MLKPFSLLHVKERLLGLFVCALGVEVGFGVEEGDGAGVCVGVGVGVGTEFTVLGGKPDALTDTIYFKPPTMSK